MITLSDGDYTCRAFFPRSLSAVHVETLMRIILQSFVEPLEDPPEERWENKYVARRAMKFGENTKVKNDGSKKALLSDWIAQDVCFNTKKKEEGKHIPFLLPYVAQVGGLRWKAGKGQEGYDKVFQLLVRAGRKMTGLGHNEILERFIKIFDSEAGGMASDLLEKVLREVELKSSILEEPEKYTDTVLCKPHAYLLQQDIELLSEWKLPRGFQIVLLKHLISFHFCAYLVRMAKAADWAMQAIAQKLDSPEAYASMVMPCSSCKAAHISDYSEFEKLAASCIFHPRFTVGGEPSQEWHEVLARYHRNIAFINLTLRVTGLRSRSDATPEDIFDLLKKLSKDNSVARTITEMCKVGDDDEILEPSKLIERIVDEKFNSKKPPKGHAWDFFNRFAPSQEARFMTRPRHGRMKVRLSVELINAWAHIYCARQENFKKSALFIEFIDFLNARGIKFMGDGLAEAEDLLRSSGLLRQYADMGIARVLEPVFPKSDSLDGDDESN